jgi:hypothetical protein
MLRILFLRGPKIISIQTAEKVLRISPLRVPKNSSFYSSRWGEAVETQMPDPPLPKSSSLQILRGG